MEAWWDGISGLNKVFVVAALAFSVAFLWQLLAMIIGMDSDSHGHVGDAGVDSGATDHAVHGEAEHGEGRSGAGAFTVLSVRSLMAFGTLFSWAGALYLASGTSLIPALLYSFLWGVIAMLAVSYTLRWILRQQEIGNVSVWSAIGEDASVYMNIPEGGTGKVRVKVSGAISFVNARSSDGAALPAGTKVRVVRVVNDNLLEVEAIEKREED